jgi:AraC family transcriptional regulator
VGAISPSRITGLIDGQVTSVTDTPVLSSAGTSWSGFLLEGHAARFSRHDVWWAWHKTHVALFTEGSCIFRTRGDAGDADFVAGPGSICIFPSGCEKTRFFVSEADFQCVVVELDAGRLEQLLHGDGPQNGCVPTPQLNIDDPQIAALMLNMRTEVEAACPAGSLYGESLSLALAAYLLGRYSAKASSAGVAERRFSNVQTHRVLDYVHAHLGSDFSLVDLARVVELSPRHFSRLFRNSLGTTPYQYVVSERVTQAKALLGKRALSIVEIAEGLGFANQSHFSDVFRKATGVPPRRYREEHCGLEPLVNARASGPGPSARPQTPERPAGTPLA